MMSRFFIDRPIFAWVIAIVIMLMGLIALIKLPIEQYPNIGLPQISINANYPGASAKVVEDSVTQVIEQGINGIDNLKYISSRSTTGGAEVTVFLEAGSDPDKAQIQVQNQIQTVLRLLPQDVQTQGVRVSKSQSSQIMTLAIYSDDRKLGNLELGDFMVTNLRDPISRINGVGQVQANGAQYAMRIWLDPERMASLKISTNDVLAAIRAQNTQVSAGSIGSEPTGAETALQAIVTAQSRFTTADQFQAIILKNTGTEPVRLRDVALIERGAESYGFIGRLNGKPSAGMQIRLAPGANALQTADRIKKAMVALEPSLPEGVKFAIPFDASAFISISITEVIKTLVEAVVLVFLVIYLFLQNWRATIIPTLAIPVVLLGTFGILAVLGFSINTLTLFGLILAIGLLVDDAIVVVENVERLIIDEGLSPREATIRSMDEITPALIGVASVLSAMFIPMAGFGGTAGIIYQQFSVTLVSAMVLSAVVAIILTPPLCATILRPHNPHKKPFGLLAPLFGGFEKGFNALKSGLLFLVKGAINHPRMVLIGYGGVIAAIAGLFIILPSSFLPVEDQGTMQTIVQMPPGTPLSVTQKTITQVADYYQKDKAVEFVFALTGGGSGGTNTGFVVTRLKPFEERKSKDMTVEAVQARARKALSSIPNATIIPTIPPTVRELGNSSGFTFQILDTASQGGLAQARADIIAEAAKNPNLTGVRSSGLEDGSQIKVNIDPTRASQLMVSMGEVNATLATALGGTYVNDFIDDGRIKRVIVQAEGSARSQPLDIGRWHVRSSSGEMVPLASLGSIDWGFGPPRLERYNGVSAIEIQGSAADGVSSALAMKEMEALVKKLGLPIGFEWSGISQQEKETGAQAPLLYGLSIIFVFLLLAALYESWSIPIAVIVAVPLGVLTALALTTLRGLDNDIFFQVGLLTTMGLSAKNAILIVEFARQLNRGFENRPPLGLVEATVAACSIRIRPIIMTSLAFTFGILPLVLANSAGAKAQNAIGTGLLGGVFGATFLTILFVPVAFVAIQTLFPDKPIKGGGQNEPN